MNDLTPFPNTSKFIKNTVLYIIFLNLFLVFGNVAKNGFLCLIYYFNHCSQSLCDLMDNASTGMKRDDDDNDDHSQGEN